MTRSSKKRSPLSAKPLRLPGQSIGQEILDVSYDGILSPLLLSLFMIIIAGLEWWRHVMNMKPSPWLYSFGALLACVYAGIRIAYAWRRLHDLKLGRDGERAVAQYLEWFRTAGFFVFHDIPNERSNIDHVLIGARGLFTIETKTISKPARGECKIRVLEGRILTNGHAIQRDPLVQSKAQARWLSTFLAESQFEVFVQPVVVFPGWFVEPFDMKKEGVWVMEPKALDRFIENEPEKFGSFVPALPAPGRCGSGQGAPHPLDHGRCASELIYRTGRNGLAVRCPHAGQARSGPDLEHAAWVTLGHGFHATIPLHRVIDLVDQRLLERLDIAPADPIHAIDDQRGASLPGL